MLPPEDGVPQEGTRRVVHIIKRFSKVCGPSAQWWCCLTGRCAYRLTRHLLTAFSRPPHSPIEGSGAARRSCLRFSRTTPPSQSFVAPLWHLMAFPQPPPVLVPHRFRDLSACLSMHPVVPRSRGSPQCHATPHRPPGQRHATPRRLPRQRDRSNCPRGRTAHLALG